MTNPYRNNTREEESILVKLLAWIFLGNRDGPAIYAECPIEGRYRFVEQLQANHAKVERMCRGRSGPTPDYSPSNCMNCIFKEEEKYKRK